MNRRNCFKMPVNFIISESTVPVKESFQVETCRQMLSCKTTSNSLMDWNESNNKDENRPYIMRLM